MYIVQKGSSYAASYHTPSKKSTKIGPILNNLGNVYKNKPITTTAAKNKYYTKNLPSLSHVATNKAGGKYRFLIFPKPIIIN
jgi:hypothetical protein